MGLRMTPSPVNARGTEIVVSALRELELTGAADYVEALHADRRALMQRAQHAIDHSNVATSARSFERGIFVDGPAFSALEELVAALEEPQPRPHLTIHNGGGPPTRATKRHVSTVDGDPA